MEVVAILYKGTTAAVDSTGNIVTYFPIEQGSVVACGWALNCAAVCAPLTATSVI